ncbi:MAG: FGGY-family carbohydrate kinase [Cyanobacteriota bacterium]
MPAARELSHALGIDLGSSGLRLALVDSGGTPLVEHSNPYPGRFEDPEAWRQGVIDLIGRLTPAQRTHTRAIAIDGTSGTLLLCRPDGALAPAGLGEAIPYHRAFPELQQAAALLAADHALATSASGSLVRALHLLEKAADLEGVRAAELPQGSWWLRHQADWLMGWLLGDWRWGEEGNNLRLGWDLQQGNWAGSIGRQSWSGALPRICPSGMVLGPLDASTAKVLGLPSTCLVVAGSTDANAAVLATQPRAGDGIAVLGTTLVLKQFVAAPIGGAGISCHRIEGQWLVGGASNAGAGILRRFFSDPQIAELSRQIDPARPSGLMLRPMSQVGERFPIDDPQLEPVLEPRPVSDALYLQALLEGLGRIEALGWQRLQELGAPPVQRVISLGGGARNPQWRALRSRLLGIPVLNRPGLSAALGMARLAARALLRSAPPLGRMGTLTPFPSP